MTETGKQTYEVTAEGTYYAGSKENKVHRPFRNEKFIVPDLAKAHHTVFRKLLPQRLATKYPDFVATRTCQISNTRTITGAPTTRPVVDTPIAEMSLDQLVQFCLDQALDIDPRDSGSVMVARKVVQDALDDKVLMRRQRDQEAQTKKAKAEEKDALDELNKDEPESSTTGTAETEGTADGGDSQEKDPLADLE